MQSAAGSTPEELTAAVSAAHSWRGVLRAIGRPESSASALRSVRRRVDELGIDHSHFTGARRWSDRDLAAAVAASTTWSDVLERLGVADSGSNLPTVRGHALRLALDVEHLTRSKPQVASPFTEAARTDRLRTAGANLAAAWFLLRSYDVLWPLEPCRYDFVARTGDTYARIQVKTTSASNTTREVSIAGTRQDRRAAYDVDEIDHFFIVDASLNAYLIPFPAVAGYQRISLNAYERYLVAEHGQWLSGPPISGRASRARGSRCRSACR